ncbi:MAG: hypothetical protein AB7O62_03300 [Pirellulales bacterium]
MSRLLGLVGTLIACFCVATVLAAGGMLGWLWSQGKLDGDSAEQVAMVLSGRDLAELAAASAAPTEPVAQAVPTPPTLEDMAAARAARLRDLELREQSLRHGLDQLDFERSRFKNERGRFEWVKEDFENKLDAKEKDLASASQENELQVWENMRPKAAKDQAMLRIEDKKIDEVVALLSRMTNAKRKKIIDEFKTEEEKKALAEILELIRTGGLDADLVDQTRDKVEQAPAGNP